MDRGAEKESKRAGPLAAQVDGIQPGTEKSSLFALQLEKFAEASAE